MFAYNNSYSSNKTFKPLLRIDWSLAIGQISTRKKVFPKIHKFIFFFVPVIPYSKKPIKWLYKIEFIFETVSVSCT